MAKFDWFETNYKKHKLKEDEEKKRKLNLKKIQNWLEYWIVFFLFYNLETFFGSFLQKIPMYLFYKVVFLAILFLLTIVFIFSFSIKSVSLSSLSYSFSSGELSPGSSSSLVIFF